MFTHICVPVDNSEYSNRAIDLAVELGRTCGATLTGIHVYAARLHDYGKTLIDEGVIKPVSSNIKVVVAIVDAFILFSAVGLFLAIELYRPHFYN